MSRWLTALLALLDGVDADGAVDGVDADGAADGVDADGVNVGGADVAEAATGCHPWPWEAAAVAPFPLRETG